MSDYFRYHGLGNDYLVLEPARFAAAPTGEAIRLICDRHRGVGSDGILWGPLEAPLPGSAAGDAPGDAAGDAAGGVAGVPALRIYNPDGSEAEKSGNGLRIFARHLWTRQLVRERGFPIATIGGQVRAQVREADGRDVSIEMGRVSFERTAIPMTGPPGEVLGEALQAAGETWTVSAANIGNPHCVVPVDAPSPELARRVGPEIERHPAFPNRTNVQFIRAAGPQAIRIEIWERGAGYTEASGSSSCAAAAVAVRLGLCKPPVTVHMPGGRLDVALDPAYHATLAGPVASVSQGDFSPEFLAATGLSRR